MVSLLGTALTCLTFGTATSLKQAVCIRLLQGVFAGSVGVARGSVAFITDPSNEGRAYAILGCVPCSLYRPSYERIITVSAGDSEVSLEQSLVDLVRQFANSYMPTKLTVCS